MLIDSSDYSALTPRHILIGETLLAVPNLDYLNTPCDHLNSWKYFKISSSNSGNSGRLNTSTLQMAYTSLLSSSG